jgi:hypothetical protein
MIMRAIAHGGHFLWSKFPTVPQTVEGPLHRNGNYRKAQPRDARRLKGEGDLGTLWVRTLVGHRLGVVKPIHSTRNKAGERNSF